MYEGFDIWTFLVGLPLALVIISIVMVVNWKKGKKERWFDERYKRIHQHARSISWGVTTAAILISWIIVIIIEGPHLAFFIITGIWVAHMVSYAIGAAIASSKN
ncbi:hypothetical protein FITA111629_08155 [Filibacter tadaridae]|uniref:DUF3796 domain-containing protein n=1 Tax=Filibacter tadaridae TaxID=2483811 RepID=A0A3P5X3R0_9BACL|nr:hypothetical protein [Filibacter tadaridae]VDC25870.1 hypothetical protein FILTAD_01336 [Filibacter tadaridae]